jgi:hypothetical protein
MKYSDATEVIDPQDGSTTYSSINYKFDVSCAALDKSNWSSLTVTPDLKAPNMTLLIV